MGPRVKKWSQFSSVEPGLCPWLLTKPGNKIILQHDPYECQYCKVFAVKNEWVENVGEIDVVLSKLFVLDFIIH